MAVYYAPKPLNYGKPGFVRWVVLSLVLYVAVGFGVPALNVGPSDEAAHTRMNLAIVAWGSEALGSRWLAQQLAWGLSYGKEATDWVMGKGWSQADIEADRQGIYAGPVEDSI